MLTPPVTMWGNTGMTRAMAANDTGLVTQCYNNSRIWPEQNHCYVIHQCHSAPHMRWPRLSDHLAWPLIATIKYQRCNSKGGRIYFGHSSHHSGQEAERSFMHSRVLPFISPGVPAYARVLPKLRTVFPPSIPLQRNMLRYTHRCTLIATQVFLKLSKLTG